MIQCKDCQFFDRTESGQIGFSCDPFLNIVEPECLQKWQLIKINQMAEAHQATLGYYQKLAPMQDKLFKAMERELDDIGEAESWKNTDDENENGGEDDGEDDGEDGGEDGGEDASPSW